MARSKKFNDLLIESLKDKDEAIAYLNAILEDCKEGDEESQKLLLLALKNIAEAQGGVARLAKKTGLGRESLYKTLSSKGNPRLTTLTLLISALGLNLMVGYPSKR